MAINFGDTIMEGGIEPSVRVQAPVQDNSGTILAESLGGAAKAVGAIAGSIFQQNQVSGEDKILSTYQSDLLDLADDVDQGMDKGEAMIRARALRREYLSNAPALREDFDKIWTSFATENGLGHVVVEGTIEQQAQEARTTEALKLGYTPQEYDTFQARARQAMALNQELEMIKASGGIVTETQRNAATQVVVGLADSAFPAAQTQINNAMKAIEANPENKAQIAAELNNTLGQNIAQLQAMSGNADAAYIVTPITGLLDTFNKWANGTIENAVLEGAIKNTQQQYAAMYSTDPVLGPLIAQSKLINDLGLAQTNIGIGIWSPEALKYLRDATDPNRNLNLLTNDEGAARFTQNIQEIATSITSESDPGVIDEAMTALNAAVDGIYINERSAKDGAIGFKDTVEMLGSPQVANLIKLGGGITAEHADQFVGVLQNNYENELVPAIQKYWESVPIQTPTAGERVTPSNIPMNQLLQPVWNGSAVEFIPNEAYKSDPRIISLAADVNAGSNSIGIPLNNLINAYANVTGEDAKSIWEKDFAGRLFNLGEEGASPLAYKVNEALDATASVPGNIDLDNRPVVNNEDGSISTERSFSVNIDGQEVLLPTVVNGKIVSEEEAIKHYETTGEHLGKFNTPEEANAYAEQLHQEQEEKYTNFTIGDFAPDTLEPVAEYVSQNSSLHSELPPIDPAYTDIEGIDYDSYLPSIRTSESGGNDSATNPTSTATGRYQFLRSTWNDLANRYPNSGITPDGRLDPNQQEIAIRIFTAENAQYLKGRDVPLSNGTLYAAHFLGASDAVKVLKASDGLVSDYVPARVVNANKFLRGMTVSEFKAWANRKGNA